jgi:hypothetical protein
MTKLQVLLFLLDNSLSKHDKHQALRDNTGITDIPPLIIRCIFAVLLITNQRQEMAFLFVITRKLLVSRKY